MFLRDTLLELLCRVSLPKPQGPDLAVNIGHDQVSRMHSRVPEQQPSPFCLENIYRLTFIALVHTVC